MRLFTLLAIIFSEKSGQSAAPVVEGIWGKGGCRMYAEATADAGWFISGLPGRSGDRTGIKVPSTNSKKFYLNKTK